MSVTIQKKAHLAMDNLFECPGDKRIAIEAGLQRIASVIIMQEKFGMS